MGKRRLQAIDKAGERESAEVGLCSGKTRTKRTRAQRPKCFVETAVYLASSLVLGFVTLASVLFLDTHCALLARQMTGHADRRSQREMGKGCGPNATLMVASMARLCQSLPVQSAVFTPLSPRVMNCVPDTSPELQEGAGVKLKSLLRMHNAFPGSVTQRERERERKREGKRQLDRMARSSCLQC